MCHSCSIKCIRTPQFYAFEVENLSEYQLNVTLSGVHVCFHSYRSGCCDAASLPAALLSSFYNLVENFNKLESKGSVEKVWKHAYAAYKRFWGSCVGSEPRMDNILFDAEQIHTMEDMIRYMFSVWGEKSIQKLWSKGEQYPEKAHNLMLFGHASAKSIQSRKEKLIKEKENEIKAKEEEIEQLTEKLASRDIQYDSLNERFKAIAREKSAALAEIQTQKSRCQLLRKELKDNEETSIWNAKQKQHWESSKVSLEEKHRAEIKARDRKIAELEDSLRDIERDYEKYQRNSEKREARALVNFERQATSYNNKKAEIRVLKADAVAFEAELKDLRLFKAQHSNILNTTEQVTKLETELAEEKEKHEQTKLSLKNAERKARGSKQEMEHAIALKVKEALEPMDALRKALEEEQREHGETKRALEFAERHARYNKQTEDHAVSLAVAKEVGLKEKEMAELRAIIDARDKELKSLKGVFDSLEFQIAMHKRKNF